MKQKYMIDTKENKLFLKEMCENLLNFGHQFPEPVIISGMTGLHGSHITEIHSRHAGCLMFIQSENIWGMKAVRS